LASSTEKNPEDLTIAKIYSVLPIWELATDADRKQKIKEAFEAKADKINADLLEYFTNGTAPVLPVIVHDTIYLSGYRIDVKDASKNDKAPVHLWQPYNKDSQQWKAIKSPTKTGYFYLQNVCSNKNLDVPNGVFNPNNALWQYSPNSTNAQLFEVIDAKDGYVVIKSALDGLKGTGQAPSVPCILSATGDNKNGTLIYLVQKKPENAGDRELWKLIKK
jgi:hypothetical protein